MIQHSEKLAMRELDQAVRDGARTYLSFGPAPIREVVRVLAQHLEVRNLDVVQASVMSLVADGALNYSARAEVSLPAGGDERDTKEQA